MSILIVHTLASTRLRQQLFSQNLQKQNSSSGIVFSNQYPIFVKKLNADEVGKKWEDVQDDAWQFPIDPTISVQGNNIIAKRNVCKTNQKNFRGSVKELWSQDDYTIAISGVLLGENAENSLLKLKDIVNYQGDVYMHCNIFEQLDIYSIVVESFSFKETYAGRYDYTLNCISDDSYDLLIDE